MAITDYSPERLKRLARTKRNRDFVAGADTVKDEGTVYLPKTEHQSLGEYKTHLLRTQFFAAAARQLEILKGMVNRKPYRLACDESFTPYVEAMTSKGQSLEHFADEMVGEYHIAPDALVVVDYDGDTPVGLSKSDAIKNGFHAYAAVYRSEDILELKKARKGNQSKVTYARIREDADTIRELKIVEGIYAIFKHEQKNGVWEVVDVLFPQRDRIYLDFIPAEHFESAEDGAPLDKICEANHTHYIASADVAMSNYWAATPIHVTSGTSADEAEKLSVANGTQWNLENDAAKAYILEWTGAGVGALERSRDQIAADIAIMGLAMAGSEKAAVEAAETHQLRRAAGVSALAGNVRTVSRHIENVLKLIAWWAGESEDLSFELSTDFTPAQMEAAMVLTLATLVEKKMLSKRKFHEILIAGEILSEADDYDTELERILQEALDWPTVEVPEADDEDAE